MRNRPPEDDGGDDNDNCNKNEYEAHTGRKMPRGGEAMRTRSTMKTGTKSTRTKWTSQTMTTAASKPFAHHLQFACNKATTTTTTTTTAIMTTTTAVTLGTN